MSTFPVDLLTEIFLLLPAKTLLRFKVVCKLWYHLIANLHFVNLHLQRSLATKTNLHFVVSTPMLHLTDFDTFENILELDYPFKHPEHGGVDVVGTCNGLLCLLENETMHWVGAGSGDDRMPRPIVAFSLQDENFSSLTLPEFDAEHYSSLIVQVLDGCLCLLVSYLGDCDVWIMEEYGVAGSWKKLFKVVLRIFIEHVDRIICYSSSGKGLFVRICPLQVAYLDLETMETTNVKVADFFRCLDAHLCVENLLMLDHTNYVWQKRGQEEG